jgi:glucan phosphoethanolaminetransferase (alkaline phosphatase superfamily)
MNFDLIRFIWIYKLIRGCFIVGNIFIEIFVMFFRVFFNENKLKIILEVSNKRQFIYRNEQHVIC